ncbi:MAG: octanoyltransferase [Legionella sp. 40-6]|nr:lipoyl(octanoyl) transferase LipB [Legionella sp.]OJY11941.1 MAG: octanoyltransferase [Legionella sp. 40-6]
MNFKELGVQDYGNIWQKMKEFTLHRTLLTPDEIWLLEHYPVYTQGQAGKAEHIVQPGSIPVVQSDRGGQVTYHGPGQLVVYFLMDIKRRNLGIKTMVSQLEQVIIALLADYEIKGNIHCGAPGVYVGEQKIASIGLRVKQGCTYHGIALNVNMDLSPFNGINPCGFEKMEMTQMSYFHPDILMEDVKPKFIHSFLKHFI